MQRVIAGFRPDDEGDWVAELSCGHDQHVRHRPPFQLRPWVVGAEGRAARIGAALDCPLCDRMELPTAVRLVRSGPEWDEHTLPAGLQRAHRLAGTTWGRLVVHGGRLGFTATTDPPVAIVLDAGSTQAIPPDVLHEVRPIGPVRVSIDFLSVAGRRVIGGRPGDPVPAVTNGTAT